MRINHSVGDWFYSEIGGEVISMPFQTKICSRVSGNSYDEAKANGKLISMSPKMFDALHQIINGDQEGYDNGIKNAYDILNQLK